MIQRERKKAWIVKKYLSKRNSIKKQLKRTKNFEEQIKLQQNLQKLPRNSCPCRIRNRCWMTGRSRGFYRDFGLSRHVLREMSRNCFLPGVVKSSW